MIFLDTSAIYALADKADSNHQSAVAKFQKLLRSGERIVLHNYILVESTALIQSRLGLQAALLFLKDARKFELEWIDANLHQEAESELQKIHKRGISLVDCTSFIVMRRKGIASVFCFDPDFAHEGFIVY